MSHSQPAPQQDSLRCLGIAFQQVREEQGLAVSELAQASGIPQQQIRALEAGTLDPDYELLLTLADQLNLRPSAFVIRAEALTTPVATGTEPVKAAPSGPPAAGPDGPTLTEPDPSAKASPMSAGPALPRTGQTKR